MINKVKRKGCRDNSTGHSGFYPHQHDDRYYTKSETDGKLEVLSLSVDGKISTLTNHFSNKIDTLDLQKITTVGNTTNKGFKFINDRLQTDFNQLNGVTGDFRLETYNSKSLGSVNMIFTPQDTNYMRTKTVFNNKYVTEWGLAKTASLMLLTDETQNYAEFNTTVKGLAGTADTDFVIKKQLDDTLDYIIEYGDNA